MPQLGLKDDQRYWGVRSTIGGNTSEEKLAQEVFGSSLHDQLSSIVVLGKLAQCLANTVCCILWHIHHSGLDRRSLACKSVKLWQN